MLLTKQIKLETGIDADFAIKYQFRAGVRCGRSWDGRVSIFRNNYFTKICFETDCFVHSG